MMRLLLLSLALGLLSLAEEPSGHLFILSGQSNMTGHVRKGFEEALTKALGQAQVTIVHQCQPGRGIRFWVADYALPEDHPMASLARNQSNGEDFPKLLAMTKAAGDAAKFKTVHFLWMQGESDANRDLGAAYERSFKVLMERLRKDARIGEMHFVIGRISDYGLHNQQRRDGWKRVREVQQKLAEDDPLGAWIDTDDFIAEDVKENQGDLHYTPENAVKLGQRFAGAVLDQLGHVPTE